MGGWLCPDHDDRLGVDKCGMPIGVEHKGLGQSGGRGHKDGVHIPPVKNVLPAGVQEHGSLELAQQVVAIEVGTAIHEYAVFGIEFPDGVASPVVVDKNSPGWALACKKATAPRGTAPPRGLPGCGQV